MKRFTKAVLTVLTGAGLLLALTGCNWGSDSHEHTYSDEWTSDETNHWHACTGSDCTEVSEKEAHTFGEWDSTTGKRVCTVCNYEESCEHTFGDYTSNNDATLESDGTKSRSCTVCGYVETVTDEGSKLYIGSKAPSVAKAVGDIVFTDGSATPYTADLTLTDTQKAAAIAVIFCADDTSLNNDDDTTTKRTLGVGIKNMRGAWCLESAKAYNTNIDTIQCPVTGSGNSMTFTGHRNGSDNLSLIAEKLGDNDDTATESNYPAFYNAKNYKNTLTCLSGTSYESGWYLPSIAELYAVYKNKTIVNSARVLCGGSDFGDNAYKASSQHASSASAVYNLGFSGAILYTYDKSLTSEYVLSIRAF